MLKFAVRMSVKSEAFSRFMREDCRGLCVRPVVEGGYCPRLKVGICAGGEGISGFLAKGEGISRLLAGGRGDFKAFSEARGDFKAFSLDTPVPSGFKFSSEI